MMMANICWKFVMCTILNTHSCHLHKKKLSEIDAMIILTLLKMILRHRLKNLSKITQVVSVRTKF